MPDAVTHPTPQQLKAFGLGKLSEPDARVIGRHLEVCPGCRDIVEHLPGDTFLGKVRAARPENASRTQLPTGRTGASPLQKAVSPAPPPHVPPELANHPKYRIVRELGRGGMGVVYQAVQTLMDRPVALKVIT